MSSYHDEGIPLSHQRLGLERGVSGPTLNAIALRGNKKRHPRKLTIARAAGGSSRQRCVTKRAPARCQGAADAGATQTAHLVFLQRIVQY
jgi:hypothetical protein